MITETFAHLQSLLAVGIRGNIAHCIKQHIGKNLAVHVEPVAHAFENPEAKGVMKFFLINYLGFPVLGIFLMGIRTSFLNAEMNYYYRKLYSYQSDGTGAVG